MLPLVPADHPGLDAAIAEALKRSRLDPAYDGTLRQLATGAMSARALHCCGSGCRPCVQDILGAAALTLKLLHEPPPPPPKGRLRRAAGAALRRLRSR